MSSPLRAIRAKCMDCSGNQTKEVRLCSVTACPLYPFRMGHLPKNQTSDVSGSNDDEEIDEITTKETAEDV